MKNFIRVAILAFAFSFVSTNAFAQKFIDDEYATKTIMENQDVVYQPDTKIWSNCVDDSEGKIVLTKKINSGSGSYSEFYNSDSEIAFSFGTGAEFLFKDKLIAEDVYSMKFYSIYFDEQENKFNRRDVVIDSLNKVFTDAKIVRISEFKNDVLKVRKTPFKTMKLLLVNDTPEYFYKYRFQGKNFEQYDVVGLLKINKMGTIELYHPNEDFRTLYIKVRPL